VAHYLLFGLALCYLIQSSLLISSTRYVKKQLNKREVGQPPTHPLTHSPQSMEGRGDATI
jgi:hypothetical protein